MHIFKPSFRLSLSLHYTLPAVKGDHKHALVIARLEKHRNVSQFWSLGLRCVALRTLWEIIEFHLNEIRQHQHVQRQAETLQHISHFPFHFLKSFTQTDALLLSHLPSTQHVLLAGFNTLARVKVDLDVQYCCVSVKPEIWETHSGVKNRKMACLYWLDLPEETSALTRLISLASATADSNYYAIKQLIKHVFL